MEKIFVDVLVGLLVALLSLWAKWQWPLIKNLFDGESRRQASQVNGKWEVTEVFADGSHTLATMTINCKGGQVSGVHSCIQGQDKDKDYDFKGTYKDQVLTTTWLPDNRAVLESGTVTAKLVKDGVLEGHELYLEPNDGKVYTATFKAEKKS